MTMEEQPFAWEYGETTRYGFMALGNNHARGGQWRQKYLKRGIIQGEEGMLISRKTSVVPFHIEIQVRYSAEQKVGPQISSFHFLDAPYKLFLLDNQVMI